MKITLANLESATAQQVFDQVANHLIKQGKISVNDKGKCVYRGTKGTMCAAGCLISDEEYDPKMDKATDMQGYSWASLIARGLVKTNKHKQLIGRLQTVHDSCNLQFAEFIIPGLRSVAIDHGLECSHIEGL